MQKDSKSSSFFTQSKQISGQETVFFCNYLFPKIILSWLKLTSASISSWKWKPSAAAIPVASSQPWSCIAVERKKRKKLRGIHIRWQGWEEECGMFNISHWLLLNLVPEPSRRWVAKWGCCFQAHSGKSSVGLPGSFVLFPLIPCCVRKVINMQFCTDDINYWCTWLLTANASLLSVAFCSFPIRREGCGCSFNLSLKEALFL